MRKTMMCALMFIALGPTMAFSAAGCVGKINRLWVENDDILYFNIRPTGACDCNYVEGDSKGFAVPVGQLNREEQYAALLAAFMGNKAVTSWFDWKSADGSVRCISWNVSFSG